MSILETLKSVLPNHNISLKEFFYLGTLFYPASKEEQESILTKYNIPKGVMSLGYFQFTLRSLCLSLVKLKF